MFLLPDRAGAPVAVGGSSGEIAPAPAPGALALALVIPAGGLARIVRTQSPSSVIPAEAGIQRPAVPAHVAEVPVAP